MAAQQLFAAKKAERSRLGFRVAMGALVVVGSAAIGGYVWWQLQPKSGLATPVLAGNMPRPLLAVPVAALPPPQAAAVAAAQDTAPAAVVAMPSAPVKGVRDDDDAPPRPRAAAPPRPAEPESLIRITKSHLRVNPAAARGFEALNAGDLETAKAEYQRLLDAEPRNGDALRGLAAVAMRQGDAAAAGDWYLKALEADPKDALAQAGLIGLRGHGGEPGDPLALESRLKTLIAARPDVGALHFALGNVHARQSRWSEAQQAFFKAFSAEPEHPDYAFNLAVSLDHLRQPALAAQYYAQALGLAAQRPAGFDKAQVAARLREIRP
jgi:tetratricopeptide (TPR) repeat protein